jgi:arylsulfatase A
MLFVSALAILVTHLFDISRTAAREKDRPNIILIFADDQGYNDLGCFGSKTIRTPNVDRLAAEGRKFTSFYSVSPVCSPSRTGLLTGCYPKRVGMHRHVLFPQSDYGLNPSEHTIADHLKTLGYATACIGKWHLGHHPETLPRANGFDSYFGIPYSNDMNHPTNQDKPKLRSDELWADQETAVTRWKTPLMENEEIVELPVDQRTITRRYTDRAIEFVTTNKDNPFFLYLPHTMPHIPLYVPQDVYDADPKNAYKCVIEHLDAEVGRLVETIRTLDLSEDTIIIYTTDNGPWLPFKNHGGSADPLRDGKGTNFEGGQRVPCVMWGPGRIPAGTATDAITSTIDLLPTIATITNSELPKTNRIDGMDISLTFTQDVSPRNEFVYYTAQGDLAGIRVDDWKLLEKAPGKNANDKNGKGQKQPNADASKQVMLFHLGEDIGEKVNRADDKPDIVSKLRQRMQTIDNEITANARPVWKKTP